MSPQDEHVAVAARAARIAVAADVPWRIKKEWLSTVCWFAAMPDPSAKLRQRFATAGFVEAGRGEHEHVVPRRWLRDAVLQAPHLAEQIFGLAIACNVTRDEHLKLNEHTSHFGWARYLSAGLDVVDTERGGMADLPRMAREQHQSVERLGLERRT